MRAGFASFGSSGPTVRIIAGHTLSGFALIGPGMPTIRKVEVHPKWTYVVPDVHVTDPQEEMAAAQVKEAIVFHTFTLGPSAHTPGTFAHWDQERDDLNQAKQLGWIPDATLANTLVTQLASARQALDAANGTLAKSRLQTLIQTISQSTATQRHQEVADLVRLNAERLIAGTPDTIFPLEPKLKLSPQSSTLPLSTLYTLTATVVNLGDPANPPIEGFPLGFEVVGGPHTGLNNTGLTDADGKLTFSYPGTQVGKDRISVGLFGEALLELDTAEVTWAGGPDLVVPLFAPPLLKSEGGKTVFVTEWTSNLGSLGSPPSTTRYFISADPQVDPTTAQVIGERAIPALAPGERSEGGTVTFTLPSDLPAGVYHLAACADALTAVVELNEDNNCSFSKLEGQTSIVVALEREAGANQPPLARAGPDQTVECRSPSGATVTLDGTASSDPDSDPLTSRWTDSFGTAQGPTPNVTLPLGAHTVTLTVEDGNGGSASDTVKITVADTKPPTATAAMARLASDKERDKRGGQRSKREKDDEEDRRERDNQNQFRVVAQAADQCDPHPAVQATINGVAVTDGQVVRLSRDDDKKISRKKGVLHIQAPKIVMTVSATDASGNRAT
ncbi:MAG: PKD domain-containing protein, partial [Nitrospiraceae bacterium]